MSRADGSERQGGFEADTAVARHGAAWAGTVAERWNVGANPNGGYTLALAVRAMLAEADRPDPLSVTAHYVRPPVAGPVEVATEVVRAGRRYATVAARLSQGGVEAVRLLGALGDLDGQTGPTRVATVAPVLPAPEACPSMVELSERSGAPVPEVMRRYDLRLDPDSSWVKARRAVEPRSGPDPAPARIPVDGPLGIRGWIRFADGAEPSVLALLAMVDAFPPTVVGALDVGWVPTVELTVQVRARPAPGWILGAFRTAHLVDGLMEQDGELWDERGRLVALSRQLALVMPRR